MPERPPPGTAIWLPVAVRWNVVPNQSARRLGHRMKGAALQLGAHALGRAALAVEHAAADGDILATRNASGPLESALQAAVAWTREILRVPERHPDGTGAPKSP